MTQVIKVSKQGINVGTATNPNDFIFDSTLNTFKIISEGTHSMTLGINPFSIQEATVAHNQSGTPFIISYCKYSNRIFQPGQKIYHGGTATSDTYFSDIRVDGTNIYFQYGNTQGGVNVTFKYLVAEPPL